MDTFGEVRLTEIARLLGTDTDTARAGLGTLVFDQPPTSSPESGQLVTGPARLVVASEYLSGNVRAKLAAATEAAAADPAMAPNVAALREVIPADLGPSEIHARLGAPWIDAPDVQQFLRATLDDPGLRVEHPGGSIWAVKGAGVGVAATSTWGTTRREPCENTIEESPRAVRRRVTRRAKRVIAGWPIAMPARCRPTLTRLGVTPISTHR
ncbi:hypothetical protein GCM10017691_20060 [Pseudonocardia petroleophila]